MHAYDRVRVGDCKHDNWCLVSASSQVKCARKITSAIINKKKVNYNGLTVTWEAGACTSTNVFPLVGCFSGFYMTEIPVDPFVVIEVK